MQEYFYALADHIIARLRGNETYTAWFSGEDSDFARFNHAKLRQAGAVSQRKLTVDLIDGRRHAAVETTLSGDLTTDRERIAAQIDSLRTLLPALPDDPHLLLADAINSAVAEPPANALPPAEDMTAQVLDAGNAYDLVGVLASGDIYHGFANGAGQRNWHASRSFNVDWSLHLQADKAVKAGYAGTAWDAAELRRRMADAGAQLDRLALPPRRLDPGSYRALLTPSALNEIFTLLSWDSFGLRAQRSGGSALRRLAAGEVQLHPSVTLTEATADGVAPNFQSAGFIRPSATPLIAAGRHAGSLVSPRSAAEFGTDCNGANSGEQPQSLAMDAGDLARDDSLALLDTGLYIGNLWYLNHSDPNAARITGMTRFATFWVENGELREPVDVLRFDDSVYRLLGDGLLGITQERELLLDPGTYGARSVDSSRLPGVVVNEMRFTL